MDLTRRRRVLEQTSRFQQTLITTTDMDDPRSFFFGPSAHFFRVDGGRVMPLANESVTRDAAALSETVRE